MVTEIKFLSGSPVSGRVPDKFSFNLGVDTSFGHARFLLLAVRILVACAFLFQDPPCTLTSGYMVPKLRYIEGWWRV